MKSSMKFQVLASLLLINTSTYAFVGTHSLRVGATKSVGKTSISRKMAEQTEVEKLRAQAAKARADADRLAKELGRDVEARGGSVPSKVQKKLSKEEVLAVIESIPFDTNNVESQCSQLDKLREAGQLSLYKSANLRTYPVSLNMLENRSGLNSAAFGLGGEGEVSLDDFKYATLGVTLGSGFLGVLSLAVLPENIGATLCYLFALIPILFLGLGSTAPAAIAEVIARIKDSNSDDENKVSASDRVARHEAAHFMCGYMCGLPIVGYNIMQEAGVPSVEFSAGTQQSFTKEQVASLSITALSGLVAESMEFGDSKGAENDLLELDQIFRRSKEFIGAAQQQDLTRWGALTAYNMIKENKSKLEQLVEAFKQQKGISECVAILES